MSVNPGLYHGGIGIGLTDKLMVKSLDTLFNLMDLDLHYMHTHPDDVRTTVFEKIEERKSVMERRVRSVLSDPLRVGRKTINGGSS